MNPRDCAWRIAADGSIFYALGGNEIVENRPRDLLDGGAGARRAACPAAHAAASAQGRKPDHGGGARRGRRQRGDASSRSTFFRNQSKWIDHPVDRRGDERREQAQQLRESWDAQTTGDECRRRADPDRRAEADASVSSIGAATRSWPRP